MRGLVLEGGGVKGAYQIGSFYAFRNCHIKFNGFVGTSIGSFNAVMLASHMERELLNFWYNVNPGSLFGIDKRFVEMVNDKELDLQGLIGAFSSLKNVVKNFGLDNSNMLLEVKDLVNFNKLRKSDKDFGLVTVRVSRKGFKPLYVYKEDITSQENLVEYLMASCYLPVFRERRIVDNHFYIDGGFYDNSPVKLLEDKGYKELYIINIKGIGLSRIDKNDKIKKIVIKPSRDNGKVLELNRSIIRDNIMMGYYDTLRVLKKLDGYKYCFKKRSNKYYDFICRKVNKKLFRRVKNFFKVSTTKEVVIKALEYVMIKEKIDYYDVYNSYKIIKSFRNISNKMFIYNFISEIRYL